MHGAFIMVGWLGRRNEQSILIRHGERNSGSCQMGKALFKLNIVKNTLILGVFFVALNMAFKRFK